MCFLGLANVYMQRFCLSMAITEMVMPSPDMDPNRSNGEDASCPAADEASGTNKTEHVTKGEFTWDEATQGLVLSAFFWGYGAMHLPGGILAEKLGGKMTMAWGMTTSSICGILAPAVASYCGAYGLIALRSIQGLGQGPIYPTLNVLLARWIPKAERGRFAALFFSGAYIGNVSSMALSGVLIYHGGWRSVFYVFGAVGLLWTLLWSFSCYDGPTEHPFISKTELEYLNSELGDVKTKENLPPIPWKSILSSGPVWSLALVQFGHDWGLFTVATDLPKYTKGIIHFSITDNGVLSAAPYLMMCLFANICGWIVDWLIGPKEINLNIVRKIFGTIGAVGPAIGILAASYSGCNKVLVTSFFIIGMGLMGAYIPSVTIIPMDMSPNYTGVLIGFSGCISSISGIFVPYIIGLLTPNNALHEWRLVFWIAFGWLVITNIVYIIYGTAQLQPWNDPKVEGNKIDTNSSNGDEKSGGEVE
ncbi:hypothetical protein AAG570_013556 [Ranatra chinensis]|uniref:Major facilitator superfamily (MFS) profile domain-containing protein n=1 Tax=Ranatra chinensis TaxID=642074 RepID=A0ABD0YD88_9HEMI